MDIKEYIEERRKRENNKCNELRDNIKILIDEGFDNRGEILGIMMDFYGINKRSPKFKKFIQCFNRIMDELNDSESEW